MNLASKSFRNNTTGELVKVIDSFENIAILEGNGKMGVDKLLDPSLYTEHIDPKNFFNNQNAYNSLAEKIKTIPVDNIPNDDNISSDTSVRIDGINLPSASDSAVFMSDPEQEKLELSRKYGASIDNNQSLQNQNEAFSRILGEGSEEELPKVHKNTMEVDGIRQVENSREYIQPTQRVDVVDPITQMFKNVKRNVQFKMNIDVSNKIPRLDFIEMMEDSYEVSIIDFLAEEFTQNLLKDPSQIKEMIKDRIKMVVYGADIKTKAITEVKKEVTEEDSDRKIKEESKILIKKTTKKASVKKSKKLD